MAGDFRKDLSVTTAEQDYNFATSLKDDPENTLKTLIAAQFSSRNQLHSLIGYASLRWLWQPLVFFTGKQFRQ